ncbi:hypothetical protein [Pelagibacterium sp.]|uniref:hypothetical protein n=1 Tax=Pelagibacterium sp. TaxID=1967288 RepID=UPI003C7CCC9F
MRLDDIDLTFSASARERYRVVIGDYNSQSGETEWHRTLERGNWKVRTRTRMRLTCDADNFYIDAELDAFEGDARVYSRSWRETVPRDHI